MHLSDAEWKVMNALWREYPATVRDVLERLAGETTWAYTTVKTILTRLAEKGALSVEKRANTSYYTPLVTRVQARHAAVQSLLSKAFGGAVGPLLHFLLKDDELSERQRAELRELIDQEADAQPVTVRDDEAQRE